jgi:nucleotide sugar dehydrogenase
VSGKPAIGIIGAGVVGAATGKGFHKLGHDVSFYDISKQTMSSLENQGYCVGQNIGEIVSNNDISFVCVNTPSKDGRQDLSQVTSVLIEMSRAIDAAERNHLIVFRSTMLPGTMRKNVISYLDSHCRKKRGRDYNVCYNPEFLRQETAANDFLNPDRVVIGEDLDRSSFVLEQIYRNLTDQIIITSFEAAEMIKYTSNCFLALKISFFNEVWMMCKKLRINDKDVSLGVSLDKRIGEYGTKMGLPFGGNCLPKDTEAMVSFAEKLGIRQDLLKVILEINKELELIMQPNQQLQRL